MTYLFIIPLSFLLICVLLYNNLISKKNKVEEAYRSIDVMLKKRTDLIPQLVNTIKGYTKHESETLISITKLRNNIVDRDPPSELRLNLESQMDRLLGKLQITVEAYPDLRASENFMLLQSSLNEVEEQLSASRRAYNAAVYAFNNTLEMFPSNIVAKFMGYSPKTMFTIKTSEADLPKVSF
ncbi:LemA family protein [[Muricauda] lutisoli]|uniref:LemA family protein n=1 Tax=[Muricauda] lutisoli TaxID=2816035 RepID=A0ABS3ESB1_9FLAO|nr:LemA family protein [[Muricauda] lutisoli]MBO0329135.1 LemA family protein [[Muricauda] lutisoli]